MKLRDFFERHYRLRKLHGKSEKTLRIYHVCFNNLERFLTRIALVSDLNHDCVQGHMQRLLDLGRAKATANRERVCLVALWRYAAQLKLVDSWPDVAKEKEPTRIPQAWLREEIDALLAAATRMPGVMLRTKIPTWLWWRTMIRLILDTGERIGAVRECRWQWLSVDSILIPAEFRKGGKADKWFSLSRETVELLAKIKAATDDRISIFPWHYCETYLWNRYKKLVESAGLPTGRLCGYHRLRKTVASVANAHGIDAQKLLDHSSSRITDRYLDPRFQRDTKASDVLANWLRNPPKDEKKRQA